MTALLASSVGAQAEPAKPCSSSAAVLTPQSSYSCRGSPGGCGGSAITRSGRQRPPKAHIPASPAPTSRRYPHWHDQPDRVRAKDTWAPSSCKHYRSTRPRTRRRQGRSPGSGAWPSREDILRGLKDPRLRKEGHDETIHWLRHPFQELHVWSTGALWPAFAARSSRDQRSRPDYVHPRDSWGTASMCGGRVSKPSGWWSY